MSEDEMNLDTLGDRKTALFVIISDTDDTFNFVVSIMYSQLFNLLCDKADDKYGGRLPVHVRFLLDECGVTEIFEGSERIFFRPSSDRKIILNNQSDCTIMKVREIIMKNKSVEMELYSKVDIVFEDEFTELMLQYKEL